MCTLPVFGYGLIAALVASSAAQAGDERNLPSVRPIMLSEHPTDGTHSIYVKGQVRHDAAVRAGCRREQDEDARVGGPARTAGSGPQQGAP